MKRIKKSGIAAILLVFALLPAGCTASFPPSVSSNSTTVPPSVSGNPTALPQPPEPDSALAQPKNATWVIDIGDTQQITDEEGLIWNYELSMHASKAGGTEVYGSYTGEIELNMSPDLDSAKALAQKEGGELLSMLFKHHSKAKNIVFDVVPYSQETYAQLVRDNMPDKPLLQVSSHDSSTNAVAITRVTFEVTQEPINMTISDGEAAASVAIPGGKTTVNVPMEISISDASANCWLCETIHPLNQAFYGNITGDVTG